MLPGQAWASSLRFAAAVMVGVLRPMLRQNLGQEVLCQQEDVLSPIAERRQFDGYDVETEIEILPEPFLSNELCQVLIRCRDDSHIGVDRGRARRRGRSSSLRAHGAAWPGRQGLISPISSKKSVPPDASSNLPCRVSRASVNAPRSWPKSSLSSSVSAIAAQFTAMNGSSRRRLK